jgi:hypothetical protein
MPPPAKKRAVVVSLPAPGGGLGVETRDGEVYNVEVLMAEPKGDSFGPVETAVWTPVRPAPTDADLYRACRNISKSGSFGGAASGSVLTSVSNAASDGGAGGNGTTIGVSNAASDGGAGGNGTTVRVSNAALEGGAGGNGGLEGRPAVVECKPKREASDKKEDFYWPEDFVLGDVVWARSGKKSPTWPALVIDPMLHAPEVVLNSCVPGALCVMFFGYSANGHGRVINHFLVLLSVGCLVTE